jgi:hypothetical protein
MGPTGNDLTTAVMNVLDRGGGRREGSVLLSDAFRAVQNWQVSYPLSNKVVLKSFASKAKDLTRRKQATVIGWGEDSKIMNRSSRLFLICPLGPRPFTVPGLLVAA